jgi:hypothetical protein
VADRNLAYYFRPEAQKCALDAYSQFADEAGWPVSEKIRLYVESWKAFGTARLPEADRRDAFEQIYDSLSSRAWQAFRSSRPGRRWTAAKVFDVLNERFRALAWGDGRTLPRETDFANRPECGV